MARVWSLSKQSQRRMAAAGVAAGITAAFNAPNSAVTFTPEEIIGDLDQTMLSGVIVAAAIAPAVERCILGQHPVFEIQRPYAMGPATSLLSYAILGLFSAIASVAFTDSLLGLRTRFKNLTAVPKWAHPAMGGVLTGVLVVAARLWLKHGGITGGGYSTLSLALTGSLPIKVLMGLCVLKLGATVCSYSRGGAGGIFAPA
jgi:CIC family chloride channel protein